MSVVSGRIAQNHGSGSPPSFKGNIGHSAYLARCRSLRTGGAMRKGALAVAPAGDRKRGGRDGLAEFVA
jgi:hypothetical protein